jgi:ABC-2 type transport system ATP-binding protein
VIISTHILSEIEQIAQRVLIIKSGQIIVDESLDLLLKSQKGAQCAEPTLEEVFIRLHSDPSGGYDE